MIFVYQFALRISIGPRTVSLVLTVSNGPRDFRHEPFKLQKLAIADLIG